MNQQFTATHLQGHCYFGQSKVFQWVTF